ncbi:hypothetical protein C7974DRAFT_328168 [Boeremia exigua]|uniref:uncharacterized protein n=1 Tax=Boeremia exigua TaxID=749465 RepID=UPI001E8D5219|nr:uncharacterized protein C7974DRAFT_328168 [Boeremia exigua]KAH6642654.1 hypothetical protein C7974DRAFT_328168 [Boeremia exigua]
MNLVPYFLSLTSRAITDYGAHLEGLQLKNNWTAAYGASYWMAELGRASPASTPPGFLLPEHILDTQFPVWRVWANWRPDLRLLQLLSSIESDSAAMLSDLFALEGPDFICGTRATLREGLVEQYEPGRGFAKFRALLIEVPSRTKEGLREVLESAISILVSILTTAGPNRSQVIRFFSEIAISRTMTQEALNLVQAVLFMSGGTKSSLGPDYTDPVLHIYIHRDELDGSHIQELQGLIQLFDHDRSSNLRRILFTPTLLQGITRCIHDGQTAINTLIKQEQPWAELAIELHTFCTVIKQSKSVPVVGEKIIESLCLLLPSSAHMMIAIDIHTAAHAQRKIDRHQSTVTAELTWNLRSKNEHCQRVAAPSYLTGQTEEPKHSLEEVVEHYISHRILLGPAPSYISQRTFESILRVWEGSFAPKLTQERRSLGVLVAGVTHENANLRIRCLNGLASTEEHLGPGLLVRDLLTILRAMGRSPQQSIVELVRLLASCPTSQDFKAQLLCWRDLAYHLIAQETRASIFEGVSLLDHTLDTMTSSEWLSFMTDVQSVFVSGPALPQDDDAVPLILRLGLQKHCAELTPCNKTLTRLEKALGYGSEAIRYILGCTKNDREVSQCVCVILDASTETAEVCSNIWDAKHGFLMIPGLPSCSQPPASANLLSIEHTDLHVSRDKLAEATKFWQKIEDELIQEADRLGHLQKALKRKDPPGTSLLLQQIGMPDTVELDEEISKLPVGVMNSVERIGDNEIEFTFSLAAFTQLQRGAMGIPEAANTIMLQILLDSNKESPPAFCLHYDIDQHMETTPHTRYSCSEGSESPTKQICTSKQTGLTWQLGRIIYSKLRKGETGINDIHGHVTASLPGIPRHCASCTTTQEPTPAHFRRSTPCDLTLHTCARLWYSIPLHVRIPEIRTDTFAVDMALSSIYAAAMSSKPELLPNCPIRGIELVKSILNSLPTMRIMRDAVDLSSVLKSYHPQAEKLISWAVVHHRGFLATATGLLKIPNLPQGTHQFVLANASSKLESAFVRKIQTTKKDTMALFHGTSLDRLPAILAQGLRVCSGTPLQRTGAAHGKGIYLSDDPSTSFYYSAASLSWKNSGLSNMRMLLGCELVGSASKVSGAIHLVTDVESVIVRYILMFTRDATMPIRGHVEPAMASGMRALRSGAV